MGTVYVARPDVSALRTGKDGRTIVGGVYRNMKAAREGREQRQALATTPVDKWLAAAVKLELERLGFDVHLTEALPGKVVRGLEVSAMRIQARDFRTGIMGQWSAVELHFTVVRAGQEADQFSAHGKYHNERLREGAAGFAQTLEGALQDCLQKAIPRLARDLAN
jgi:hypothetical protein